MNFKYFTLDNTADIDSVKKQFKNLAFKYHPDITGRDSNREMQEIISEYEAAIKYVGELKNKDYSLDQDYIDIINELVKMNMENVTIEICGWFIYLHGNTKQYKEKLKELKFFWNPKKKLWYYKPSWYVKRNKNSWSMDRIRETWGSQVVNHEREKQQDRILVTA